MTIVIDGKATAAALRARVGEAVAEVSKTHGFQPGLAVVLVGEDPASAVYVRNKGKATIEAGLQSFEHKLDARVSEADLLALIERLNTDDAVDGILVQLPLPKHLDTNLVIETISPEKDVDGFHSENIGKLMQNKANLRPCTPKGVMTMLATTGIDLIGKDCVVIGASNIVGRPMAMELLNAGATVTICNSKTQDLSGKLQRADVIVVAVGVAHLVKGDWIKKGAVVIDVGINRLETGKLVGDVDFESAIKNAGWISPVPGGVGPMTIACLLRNTLECFKAR